MPISKKQLAANRANAQKSTGPQSAETKAIVAQNPVQHGLCGRFRVLPEIEKQEQYDALLAQLIKDEQPVGQAEIELVVKMAQHTWLANRALRCQNNCFALQPKTPEDKRAGATPVAVELSYLERYVRYHAAQDRAYNRASAELQKRKKARQLAENGSASQKRLEAEQARKETRAAAAESRQIEKHAAHMTRANMQNQQLEIKLAYEFAKILPDSAFPGLSSSPTSAAAPTSHQSPKAHRAL